MGEGRSVTAVRVYDKAVARSHALAVPSKGRAWKGLRWARFKQKHSTSRSISKGDPATQSYEGAFVCRWWSSPAQLRRVQDMGGAIASLEKDTCAAGRSLRCHAAHRRP